MLQEEQMLRALAREYAEAAADPRNSENRRLHAAVNDRRMIRPVVLIDEIPFHELNFDGSLTLHCEDPILRAAEDYLRKKLFQWKHFPADMILPPYYPVEKIIHSTGCGFSVEENTADLYWWSGDPEKTGTPGNPRRPQPPGTDIVRVALDRLAFRPGASQPAARVF